LLIANLLARCLCRLANTMHARASLLLTLALFTSAVTRAQPPVKKPAAVRGTHVTPPRPVLIENGRVQGFFTSDSLVIAYKGIPYAQPPIDELRWQPPVPLIGKWKRTLIARDFGPHCIQSGSYPDMVFRDPGPSEDCLTLNVWAPAETVAAKPTRKLPVMVWIYGGGFTTGGTSEAREDGEALARRGVIVVSMNYRLGIFGFLSLPELTENSPRHTSGNYGLMDQAAALAWVHRNIAAFGGDPANVTLFGQSSGGDSVSEQMASPLANSLFVRAIGQSGGAFPYAGRIMPSLTQAERVNADWATRAFGSDKLFYLRQLPADEIMEATQSRRQPAPRFGPVVDGFFLPDYLPRIYADGKQAHIPLIAGWTADERHPPQPVAADDFLGELRDSFGSHANDALTLYPIANDAELARSVNDFEGDRAGAYATWAWLEAHSRTGDAPVYRYRFDLPSPGDRNHAASLGAFHSDDIEYEFGTLDSRPGMTVRPEDRALSDLIQQYWVNFARSGDPNGPGLPPWPTYNHAANSIQSAVTIQNHLTGVATTSDFPVMHFDANSAAKPDTFRPRYLFLDQFWSLPTGPAALQR
jgi:para-nitrobenzyl esterase